MSSSSMARPMLGPPNASYGSIASSSTSPSRSQSPSPSIRVQEQQPAPTSRWTSWATASDGLVQQNKGLALISAAQMFFSAANVAVKMLNSLETPVPPLQFVAVRMAITYAFSIAYMLWAKVPEPWLGPPGVRLLLFVRGLFGFFGLWGIYYSLQYLSLSDATVLTFLTPLTTGLAGALILKEHYTLRQGLASLVSMIGVVLIARPAFLFGANTDSDERGTPAQRLAAVGLALVGVMGATGAYISIRAIGKQAHPLHALSIFSLHSVVVSSALMLLWDIPFIVPKGTKFLVLLSLIGVFGFIAQILLTLGLQRETAGRGIMGVYVQLIFATIFERIFFHTIPSPLSIVGTVIIMSSAIFVALTKETPKAQAVLVTEAELEEGLLDHHDGREEEDETKVSRVD